MFKGFNGIQGMEFSFLQADEEPRNVPQQGIYMLFIFKPL